VRPAGKLGMTDAIVIIPARSGSKRLPRKNILSVNGRPLIAHTIEAALTSACFSSVIVSTEDQEIAAVATAAGAEIHGRDGRSNPNPSRSISGARPDTISATIWPQPHACVQPFEPWPTLRISPSIGVRPR